MAAPRGQRRLLPAPLHGRYCPGCEQFYPPGELPDGRCPEHGTAPDTVAEENWFFRLSRYAGAVQDAILSGRVRIEPAARRNEVLAFLRGGVADISVSRPATRSGGWGIPVPDDPDQVVYVWWDALANYVTALDDEATYRRWWVNSAERVHVIGKGIVRFHAVYWLALLAAVGLPLPTAVFVHEYLTLDGVKISKSRGNAVDPLALVARFGPDAVRWWLVREVNCRADTDFTVPRLVERANRELAHGLGNLVNRTVSLVHRHRIAIAAERTGGRAPRGAAPGGGRPAGPDRRRADRFDFRAATDAIWALVAAGNRAIERERPWQLPPTRRRGGAGPAGRGVHRAGAHLPGTGRGVRAVPPRRRRPAARAAGPRRRRRPGRPDVRPTPGRYRVSGSGGRGEPKSSLLRI